MKRRMTFDRWEFNHPIQALLCRINANPIWGWPARSLQLLRVGGSITPGVGWECEIYLQPVSELPEFLRRNALTIYSEADFSIIEGSVEVDEPQPADEPAIDEGK